MLTSIIVRIIDFCIRNAWRVVAVGLLLTVASGVYAARHFAINSDIDTLLPSDLGWRERELAFEQAFHRFQQIIVVVQAPTPELTSAATDALTQALAKDKGHFRSVSQPGGSAFFVTNGLLFKSPDELKRTVATVGAGGTAHPRSRRRSELARAHRGLEDGLLGIQSNRLKLDDFTRVFNMASDTLENVIKGEPASFSWRVLVEGHPATPSELRGIIAVRPMLDYSAIEPGHAATEAIRQMAAPIASKYQATVRLTGPVAMADEEFATIKEGAVRNGIVTVIIVLVHPVAGFAVGAPDRCRVRQSVHRSCADGGRRPVYGRHAQFDLGLFCRAVRRHRRRFRHPIQRALPRRAPRTRRSQGCGARTPANSVGAPLTLAAGATAAGFLSFLPTDYRGVSELGLIAGFGMLIAFATSVTILPALIRLLNPPGEPEDLGFRFLAPVDRFLERQRIPIIAGTAIVVIAGLPLLYWLSFDFNPINLRDPHSESIATYLELARDPSTNSNAVEVLAPSLAAANADAARLSKVPEVSHVLTLTSFIPTQQEEKLPLHS